MKTTLLKALVLVLLVGCNSSATSDNSTKESENQPPLTKNQAPKSQADHVKDSLIVPAIDALSYQLEKSGYDTYVLNRLSSFLKDTSITEFLKTNPTVKEIEKAIESSKPRPVENQKKSSINQGQEVFETF